MMRTILAAATALLTFSAAPAAAQRFGINLAGCEFVDNGALCPNRADVDWYVDKAGFTLIRVPAKTAQLLDPKIRAKIADTVAYAQSKGAEVIVDRHSYQAPRPEADVAFWREVLPSFSDATLIDMMNEPVKGYTTPRSPWQEWAVGMRAVIAGIRQAGFKHQLLAEWPMYSATFRFIFAARELDKLGGFGDPLKRTHLSAHRYFDKGNAGISPICGAGPGKPTATLSRFAELARARGLKAYITESAFGGAGGVTPNCAAKGAQFIAELKANSDVLAGITWWGGGRGWGDKYIFNVEPKKGTRATAPVPAYTRQIAGR